MTKSEIVNELKSFYEIATELPSTNVGEVSEIANDLAYDIDRLITDLEEEIEDEEE